MRHASFLIFLVGCESGLSVMEYDTALSIPTSDTGPVYDPWSQAYLAPLPPCAHPANWREKTKIWKGDIGMTVCKSWTSCEEQLGGTWHLCTEREFLERNDDIMTDLIFTSRLAGEDGQMLENCYAQNGWSEGGWTHEEHDISSDALRLEDPGDCSDVSGQWANSGKDAEFGRQGSLIDPDYSEQVHLCCE